MTHASRRIANPAASSAAATGPDLTEEQRLALETWDASVSLSAGAGCGKTFVLTQRFLRGVERGVPLGRIVAITFTERAAREMRDRIRKECRQRLRDCPVEEAARWQALVRDVDGARISTIHAFCGALLRAHAVEAGIDPFARMLDELAAGVLRSRAASEELQFLLEQADEDAVLLAFEQGLERTIEVLEAAATIQPAYDFGRWLALSADALADFWLLKWQNHCLPEQVARFKASEGVAELMGLLSRHRPTNPVMQERVRVLRAHLHGVAATGDLAQRLAEMRENARVQGGGNASAWESDEVYDAVRSSFEALRNAIDGLKELLDVDAEQTRSCAACSLAFARVAHRVRARYQQSKRALGMVDFDDLLVLTRKLLTENRAALRQAIDSIDLLLVDEFQDTDPVQAEILRLLCGDAFRTGKLFVVGDFKQSIYRFRGAEPKVFRQYRAEMPEAGRLSLTLNFRSQPAILQFVNALCDGALGDDYEPLRPHRKPLSREPCIEFLFADSGAREESDGAQGRLNVDARRALEADWIARRVKQILEDPQPRICPPNKTGNAFELRRVEARDIVLLFRAMTSVQHYERALRELGIDYYVVGGSAFYAQQEIFDVSNLLACIDNVDDEVSLLGVLRSGFFSCSDDVLMALLGPGSGDPQQPPAQRPSLWSALHKPPPDDLSARDRQRLCFAASVLSELHSLKHRLSIHELLKLAIDRTGYDAALLTEFLGTRKLANLRKLCEMAREFDRTESLTLAEFIGRLRSAMFEEAVEPLAAMHPESGNVVRLMSIHQAKGLEFPVVFVADTDRGTMPRGELGGLDQDYGPLLRPSTRFERECKHPGLHMAALRDKAFEQEELMRLFYVACTRAADLLVLSACLDDLGKPSGPWTRLLNSRFDLRTGQPRFEPGPAGPSPMSKYASCLPEIRVHHKQPELPQAAVAHGRRGMPLDQLRGALEAAVPTSLPALAMPVPPKAPLHRRWSVSAVEDEVARLLAESPGGSASLNRLVSARLASGRLDRPEPSRSADVDPIALGNVVHAVLERCDPFDKASALALADALLLAEEHADAALLREAVSRCVEAWFGASARQIQANATKVYREIEFLLPWMHAPAGTCKSPEAECPVVISGTLDCLVQSAEGRWIVLDYKTSHLAGLNEQEVLRDSIAHYGVQLALYSMAVERLVGQAPERLTLVYLPSGAHIDLQLEPGGLAGIVQLVEQALRGLCVDLP